MKVIRSIILLAYEPENWDRHVFGNSVDPDQTAPREQSDLGLHCRQQSDLGLHYLQTVLQIMPKDKQTYLNSTTWFKLKCEADQ